MSKMNSAIFNKTNKSFPNKKSHNPNPNQFQTQTKSD